MEACAERCTPTAAESSSRAPHQVAPASVGIDQTGLGRRSFCSWHDAGWRSLLLRELTCGTEVVDFDVPPTPDQLLVLALDGTKTLESRRGRHWRRAHFGPGRIAMTMPRRPVRVRWRRPPSGPQRSLQLHLPGSLLSEAAQGLWGQDIEARSLPDALSVEDPLLEQVMIAVARSARQGIDDFYAQCAAAQIAVHLLTQHVGGQESSSPGREDQRVRRAQEFMRSNLHHPVQLGEIAREVGLSHFHLLRVFRESTGQTPHQYLVSSRIEAARRLLRETRLPVRDVARRCGFGSATYFSQAFRARTGLTPTQFRDVAGTASAD